MIVTVPKNNTRYPQKNCGTTVTRDRRCFLMMWKNSLPMHQHLLQRRCDIILIGDNHIRHRDFVGLGCLSVDAGDRLGVAHVAGATQAFDLQVTRCGHHPHCIADGGPARFDKLDGVYDRDNGLLGRPDGQIGKPLCDVVVDGRVDECLQCAQFGYISKYDFTQRPPINLTIWLEDVRPKCCDDRIIHGLAWLLEQAGDLVGVDDMGTEALQFSDHGAFATGNLAGQANDVFILVRHILV